MTFPTHNARLTAPLEYRKQDGTSGKVPSGACLMEQTGNASMDLIWGLSGENSATLSVDVVKAAAQAGHLILSDQSTDKESHKTAVAGDARVPV